MKQLKNGRGLTDSQMGFLLIVPGLAVFLAIILYPFVDAVITSFTDRSLIINLSPSRIMPRYSKTLTLARHSSRHCCSYLAAQFYPIRSA